MIGLSPSTVVNLFKDLLSLLSDKIPQAKEVLDHLKTDPKLEIELEKLAQKRLEIELEKEKIAYQDRVSARELAMIDVLSDNFLSKNIRPITLIVILAILVIYALRGDTLSPELKGLFEIVFVFYFGGRSFEKIAAMTVTGKSSRKN